MYAFEFERCRWAEGERRRDNSIDFLSDLSELALELDLLLLKLSYGLYVRGWGVFVGDG